MSFNLRRLRPGDEAILGCLAPDVFDEPVRPDRLAAYVASPAHLMVVALDGNLVVGQCAGVVHAHPDKVTELYVDEVGTATSHLRQGIATAMMRELFAWAASSAARRPGSAPSSTTWRPTACIGPWAAARPRCSTTSSTWRNADRQMLGCGP